MKNQIIPLAPESYQRHLLHTQERTWAETNCYVDLWIELLHSWGLEPLAALPFTLTIDFEGDQWTFFKFPLADLYELYGLDVQELAIWKRVIDHVEEQVILGRPVLVELDSYYLPDTVGTAYQRAHTKTTVAVNAIDVQNQWLGYFHNQGYFQLQGDDFINIFNLHLETDALPLPPYVEFVKRRSRPLRTGDELVQQSLGLLRHHLNLLPEENPFEKFKTRFARDLDWLTNEPLDVFHKYSFTTLRQIGACFELLATYLNWLQQHRISGLAPAQQAFSELSNGAKTLQFNLARAVARKKILDLSSLSEMAERWQSAMSHLRSAVHEL